MVTCSGGRGQTREGQDQGAGPEPAALGSAGHCSGMARRLRVLLSCSRLPLGLSSGERGGLEGGRRKGRSSPTLPAPGRVCPSASPCWGGLCAALSNNPASPSAPAAPGLVGLSALAPLWAASRPCARLLSSSTPCVASSLSVSSPWLNLTVTKWRKGKQLDKFSNCLNPGAGVMV